MLSISETNRFKPNFDLKQSHNWRGLILIFVLAFGLRAFMVHLMGEHYIHTDTHSYWQNAQSLATRGLPDSITPKWSVQIGFSWILAPFAALGCDLAFVGKILMPLIGALVALMAGIVATQLADARAGILAGWCCALNPNLVNYSTQIMTEQPTALVLLLCFYHMNKMTQLHSLWAGLYWGLACVMRAPCLGALLMVLIGSTLLSSTLSKSIPLILIATTFIIVICVYQLSVVYGHLVFLTPQTEQLTISAPIPGGMRWLEEDEIAVRGSYLHFARTHPIDFLQERLISLVSFVSPWPLGSGASLLHKFIIAISDASFMLAAMFVFLMGRWRQMRVTSWLLPLAWMGMCLFHTLTYAVPRYKIPVLPLLIAFAAAAWFSRGKTNGLKIKSTPTKSSMWPI